MSYLSKDQLDKYLNNLPGKTTAKAPSSPTTHSPSKQADGTLSTNAPTPSQENKQYNKLRNDLVYPMQKLGLNANTPSGRGPGQDAFETSLRSSPGVPYSKKQQSSGATNTKPPPSPAKKPAHLSGNVQQTPTNKVSVPNPLYSQTRCGACNKPVSTGVMVSALGKKWHAGCFACCTCGDALDKVEFFEKDGKPYCEADYRKLFNARCDHCKQMITDTSIQALGKHYHVGHFFCHSCKTPFDEQSAFMVHDGHPYCEKDYLATFGHQCQGCGQYIKGQFVGALGGDWHKECFVCADCGKPFPSGTFHVRDNRPYCEQHAKSSLPTDNNNSHDHLNASKTTNPDTTKADSSASTTVGNKTDSNQCHSCKESLADAKMISSAFGNNYHSHHFQCSQCQRPLSARVPGLWENDGRDGVICKQCARTRG